MLVAAVEEVSEERSRGDAMASTVLRLAAATSSCACLAASMAAFVAAATAPGGGEHDSARVNQGRRACECCVNKHRVTAYILQKETGSCYKALQQIGDTGQ